MQLLYLIPIFKNYILCSIFKPLNMFDSEIHLKNRVGIKEFIISVNVIISRKNEFKTM